jgi:DNA mismatch repair protein MLH1
VLSSPPIDRLVDCPSLKRALEALYSSLLPKGGHPWVYISLEIAPEKVDVNVHPTKREVHFLDEDDIVESVCSHIQKSLVGANQSRTFRFSQILLPGASEPPSATAAGRSSTQSGYPRHTVRTDSNTQTLDAHLTRMPTQGHTDRRPPSSGSEGDEIETDVSATMWSDGSLGKTRNGEEQPPVQQRLSRSGRIRDSESSLISINELRKAIVDEKHRGKSTDPWLFACY